MSGPEVVVVLVAVGLGSLLKSITGMGVPLVAVPTISLAVGVEEAVIVIALPNLVLNVMLAWRERGHLGATRDLERLGLAGLVGAVAGTLLLVAVPDEPLVVLLAVVVLGYAASFLAVPDLALEPATARRWAPAVGLSAGFMQGAVGISGPIVGTWILSYRLERHAYILSVTALFSMAGLSQVVVLVSGGDLSGLWLATLLACIPALATVPVGARLRGRLSSRGFDLLIVTMLVVSTLVLLARTFS